MVVCLLRNALTWPSSKAPNKCWRWGGQCFISILGVSPGMRGGSFTWHARGLTWHVDHPTIAVLHDVAGLAVDPAGGDTVRREVAGLQGLGFTLSPRGRQVGQLHRRENTPPGYSLY